MPTTHFAKIMRGQRIGFYYSNLLHAFVRMSWADRDKEVAKIEICPPSQLHDIKHESGLVHIVLGSMRETNELIESIQLPTRTFEKYTSYLVNADGQATPYT